MYLSSELCEGRHYCVHQWREFCHIRYCVWNIGSFMLPTGYDMILLVRNSDDWLSEAAITNSNPRFLLVYTENHTCLLHTNFCCLIKKTDAECRIWGGQLSNTFDGKLFYFLVFPTNSRYSATLTNSTPDFCSGVYGKYYLPSAYTHFYCL
jgi:hypothetical protein